MAESRKKNAAEHLVGLALDEGWTVKRLVARGQDATGGNFSHSYIVERDGKEAFLKAFDFSGAFQPGKNVGDELRRLLVEYDHEKGILEYLDSKKLKRVACAIGSGNVAVPGMEDMAAQVFYLIFEIAEGDVRIQMDSSRKSDYYWCMNVLSDIADALFSVHRQLVSHQDTKPSNVLVFSDGTFKVSDFGRAIARGQPGPYDSFTFAGDWNYAPPEAWYGYRDPDFRKHRIGTDIYMFGNLAVFIFTGVNIPSLMMSKLDQQHKPSEWGGTYNEVMPYLQAAFAASLAELVPLIDTRVRADVLPLVTQLCEPDIHRRGHPRGLGNHSQYSLERYVSQLGNVVKRMSLSARKIA